LETSRADGFVRDVGELFTEIFGGTIARLAAQPIRRSVEGNAA